MTEVPATSFVRIESILRDVLRGRGLERADGTQYYYAHMTTITDGLAEGSKVAVGQLVGTVGNTGDARYGAAHLHFEIHPGGGSATNPYSHLVAVDPAARTQARTTR